MEWELWVSKVDSQDMVARAGDAAHPGKLGPGHQAEGAHLGLCEDSVHGVQARWTLEPQHPDTLDPWHLCPGHSASLWLLQRAAICDREPLGP